MGRTAGLGANFAMILLLFAHFSWLHRAAGFSSANNLASMPSRIDSIFRWRKSDHPHPRGSTTKMTAAASSIMPRSMVIDLEDVLNGRISQVTDTTPGPGLHSKKHLRVDMVDSRDSRESDGAKQTRAYFVKVCDLEGCLQMHFSEFVALEAIWRTNTVRVPRPLHMGWYSEKTTEATERTAEAEAPTDNSDGGGGGRLVSYLVMDYLDFVPFGQSIPEVMAALGRGLALLHLAPVKAAELDGIAMECAKTFRKHAEGIELRPLPLPLPLPPTRTPSAPGGAPANAGAGAAAVGFPFDNYLGGYRQKNGWVQVQCETETTTTTTTTSSSSSTTTSSSNSNTAMNGAKTSNGDGYGYVDFFVRRRLQPQLLKAFTRYGYDQQYGVTDDDRRGMVLLVEGVLDVATEILQQRQKYVTSDSSELASASTSNSTSMATATDSDNGGSGSDISPSLSPSPSWSPSLLHGDLWLGNCGGIKKTRQPAIFDAASAWVGDPEFDLALASLLGGFLPQFYQEYHKLLPRSPGFRKRHRVYRLYHLLNHLNLHGAGFGRSGTVTVWTKNKDGKDAGSNGRGRGSGSGSGSGSNAVDLSGGNDAGSAGAGAGNGPMGYYERSVALMREIVTKGAGFDDGDDDDDDGGDGGGDGDGGGKKKYPSLFISTGF